MSESRMRENLTYGLMRRGRIKFCPLLYRLERYCRWRPDRRVLSISNILLINLSILQLIPLYNSKLIIK